MQLLFVVSFFLSRIAVMPDLVRSLAGADWASVPGWQANLALSLVPIPFLLNTYWQVMIFKSVAKVVMGGGGGGGGKGGKGRVSKKA